jgi:hypothetical protein
MNIPVPLPHTGKRRQITSHVAMIAFPGHDVCCMEVKDGNPDKTFPPPPHTYSLRAEDLTFYYFLNTPKEEALLNRIVLD